MIIHHGLKVIFFKTIKTAGTSFEIALSKYCGPDDIVTPISVMDAETRTGMGFQEPVNYLETQRQRYQGGDHPNASIRGNFRNHVSSQWVKERVPDWLFRDYTKIAVHRDPLDCLISHYFFLARRKDPDNTGSFADWLRNNYKSAADNLIIAPHEGDCAVDHILRYETLLDDIRSVSALPDGLADLVASLSAKGGLRDVNSYDALAFFGEHGCSDYIPLIRALHPYG